MPHIFRLLTLGLTLLVTSCFEVREEIWIDARGGGRMQMDYSLPRAVVTPLGGEAGIREQVDELLREAPELRLDELVVTHEDDQILIHAELSTDSMFSLLDLSESAAVEGLPDAALKLIGEFEFQREGTDITFARKVDVGSALGLAAMMIPKAEKAERRMTYIIHLPTAANVHSADRTEDEGRTLIWDKTLGEAMGEPMLMTFTAPIPLPWGWIAAAMIIIMAIPVFAIRRWRKRAAIRKISTTAT
ncbi:hypothetical protein [Haloferula rosea]|uniref:DUF3153 domain-containing protein n=1 Tax=Haloferula rosea TaxID=490093 RepID=A0A934VG11_9BACT|nr:hypothetical protein [Haloferula rosea]MBK1827611.1 hypothetical protein [Haloferula rosea]